MKKNQVKLNAGVKKLIKEFGGQKKLADALNVDLSLIYRWLHSKLPPSRVPQILSIMKRKGISIKLCKFNPDYFDENNNIKFS